MIVKKHFLKFQFWEKQHILIYISMLSDSYLHNM